MSSKRIDIEALRIVASFLVLFNHSNGYSLYIKQSPNHLLYWCYLFLAITCKVAVPLFFSIAGSLLLSKKISNRKLFSQKILKHTLTLIAFSIFYYILQCNRLNKRCSLSEFLIQLYTGKVVVHLWYLYAYLSFLIASPILRTLVTNLKTDEYVYLFLLHAFFVGIIAKINFSLRSFGRISPYFMFRNQLVSSKELFYPILGYFLDQRIDVQLLRSKHLIFLWLLTIICTIIACINTFYLSKENNYSMVERHYNDFIVIDCIAIFLSFKHFYYSRRMQQPVEAVLRSIGSCTYGIYLVHLSILQSHYMVQLEKTITKLAGDTNCLLMSLSICIVTFLLSYVVTIILSRIPLIRYLVGF